MADPVVKPINGPIYLSPFQKIVAFNFGGVAFVLARFYAMGPFVGRILSASLSKRAEFNFSQVASSDSKTFISNTAERGVFYGRSESGPDLSVFPVDDESIGAEQSFPSVAFPTGAGGPFKSAAAKYLRFFSSSSVGALKEAYIDTVAGIYHGPMTVDSSMLTAAQYFCAALADRDDDRAYALKVEYDNGAASETYITGFMRSAEGWSSGFIKTVPFYAGNPDINPINQVYANFGGSVNSSEAPWYCGISGDGLVSFSIIVTPTLVTNFIDGSYVTEITGWNFEIFKGMLSKGTYHFDLPVSRSADDLNNINLINSTVAVNGSGSLAIVRLSYLTSFFGGDTFHALLAVTDAGLTVLFESGTLAYPANHPSVALLGAKDTGDIAAAFVAPGASPPDLRFYRNSGSGFVLAASEMLTGPESPFPVKMNPKTGRILAFANETIEEISYLAFYKKELLDDDTISTMLMGRIETTDLVDYDYALFGM